ncbi:hypothetical protein HAV15_008013 [Penicillium sp. str. |nr:hypothetical protein HAV15_008013 [Penicillium sp. str. \
MAGQFDVDFYHSLAATGKSAARVKWYRTAIVALGALNYPEEIPKLYQLLLTSYIPEADQQLETGKIRESLTKVCGIMGAAKTGSALRALATATPSELMDSTYHREGDTSKEAIRRGRELFSQIYERIPGYDLSKTLEASPDYYHIVTELFYGHIFSFNGVLDGFETGHIIVAALLGIDCHEQAHNHMLGMLIHGADREGLESIRSIVVSLANHYDVRFKNPPITIPDLSISVSNICP